MTYENGNNIYNYFSETLKKYSKDEFIFINAMQYMANIKPHELKYNFNEINSFLKTTMNTDLYDWFFQGKYTAIELANREKLEKELITKEFYEAGAIWDREHTFGFLYNDSNSDSKEKYDSLDDYDLLERYCSDLLDRFEVRATVFYKFLEPYMAFYFHIDESPYKLVNIKFLSFQNNNKTKTMILTRNDGSTFSLDINLSDIEYLIGTLENAKVDKDGH